MNFDKICHISTEPEIVLDNSDGEYTNIAPPKIKNTEGEISGAVIELWKCDDEILGLYYEYCGLPADPPTGKLDSIKYDSSTGNISFKVKISLGGNYDPVTKIVTKTRDRYSFAGKFKLGINIKGIIEYRPDNASKSFSNRLLLKYKAKKPSNKIRKTDLEKEIKEILEFRGPKW